MPPLDPIFGGVTHLLAWIFFALLRRRVWERQRQTSRLFWQGFQAAMFRRWCQAVRWKPRDTLLLSDGDPLASESETAVASGPSTPRCPTEPPPPLTPSQ